MTQKNTYYCFNSKRANRVLVLLYFLISAFSIDAQTYDAPTLDCVQRFPSTNQLTWTIPTVTCGAFVKYYIYVSNAKTGPYTLHDSIPNAATTTYTHLNINNSLPYYYYMTSSYTCAGMTSTHSDTLDDTTLPDPLLYSISIENNHPVYTWAPLSTIKDVWGYLVFTPVKIIDTVEGRTISQYTDLQYDVQSAAYQGGIAATDKCGGINGRSGFNRQQITSFLSINNNPCDGNLSLTWTAYKGWTSIDGVKEYQILIKKNSEPEQIVATNDPTSLNFIYGEYQYGDTISVRIKAIHPTDASIFSHSNQFSFISEKNQKPAILHGISASYIGDNIVKVRWYCDTNSRPSGFDLKRLQTKNNSLLLTTLKIDYINEGKGYYSFIDSHASYPYQTSYQLVFHDLCDNKSNSTPVNTEYLKVTQIGLYKNELTWSPKLFGDSVLYTVLGFEVYFSIDGQSFVKLEELQPNIVSYQHSVETLLNNSGTYCYYIKTLYEIDTTQPIQKTNIATLSPRQCIDMRTVLWMPNAFKVNGYTPVFKPKLIFWTSEIFSMTIFNRWGQEIYATTDPNQGWNGNMNNGTAAAEGSYIYKISYQGNDGKTVVKTGNFVLLK